MLRLRAILRLTRLDSSLLAPLAIFLPLWVRTGNLAQSFARAIPLLFSFMCTFIANDLDDVEKDRVNHPDRPLPAGHLTPAFAAVLYFTCLALALFSTRHYVAPGIAFLYYALIALLISYGHIVDWLPVLKAPYVATVTTIPVLIVATLYPGEGRLYLVAAAVFFLVIGREICMDIRDRPGDATSFMHRFRPAPLAVIAFSLQLVGLLLLASQTRRAGDIVALLVMAALLAQSGVYWFKFSRYRPAIVVMKLQWFVGLYFLT
jgi:geranylgeranylglycerol-phosphate geranylgeranyltransferase